MAQSPHFTAIGLVHFLTKCYIFNQLHLQLQSVTSSINPSWVVVVQVRLMDICIDTWVPIFIHIKTSITRARENSNLNIARKRKRPYVSEGADCIGSPLERLRFQVESTNTTSLGQVMIGKSL